LKKNLLIILGSSLLILVMALMPFFGACAPEPPPPPPPPPDEDEEPPPPPPKVYTVCITQIVTHPDLDNARRGFIEKMEELGYAEGVNIDYIMRNAAGDMSVNAAICEYFVSLKPDLILAITTPCIQAMTAAAEGTDIPVVFTCVTDPVAAGVVPSWTESAPLITGVSDWNDITTQMEFIRGIFPFETLGIIYNAGEVNSVVQAEELVEKVAPKLGFTVIEATVAATIDVLGAAQSLVGRVDAMWIPTDNTAMAGIHSILKVAEENDIPFFGSTTSMAESGTVAGCGVNEYLLGKQAAVMAAKILSGEATPGDIPPEKGEQFLYAVNLAAAERMGVTIPQAVIDMADLVFEE